MDRPANEHPDGFWTLHQHDARDLQRLLADHSSPEEPLLTATITSPPYGSLKDYGHAQQIGFGQSYQDYLDDMQGVFSCLHEHTKVDGSLWLIADTYMEKGDAPCPLIPLPFDLSAAAQAVGWTLRDVVIWQKDRTLPWSNGTRLRNTFEYVLLLVKGPEPKYRLDRLRDHHDSKEWWVRFPERYSPKGKAPSNIWTIPIPVQGSWGNGELEHSCPLPPELVRRLVFLSSDPGDVVLDPFAGSGIVPAVAERLGRKPIGCELVGRHVADYRRVVRPEILGSHDNGSVNGRVDSPHARLIVDLRILKFVRVVMQAVARYRDVPWPSAALVLRGPTDSSSLAKPRVVFLLSGDQDARTAYEQRAKTAAAQRPASKFGLDAQIEVASVRGPKLNRLTRGRQIHMYVNGRTTRRSISAVPHSHLLERIADAANDSVPPIFSDIEVDVAPRPDASVLSAPSD